MRKTKLPAMPNPLPDLDPLLHSRLRLAVVSVLMNVEEADFTFLRERTAATAGNLSVQLEVGDGRLHRGAQTPIGQTPSHPLSHDAPRPRGFRSLCGGAPPVCAFRLRGRGENCPLPTDGSNEAPAFVHASGGMPTDKRMRDDSRRAVAHGA